MYKKFGILQVFMLSFIVMFLFTSCGDDDNPLGPGGNVSTFYKTFDFGQFDHMGAVCEASNGTIIVGGNGEIYVIDSSGPTIDSFLDYQAILFNLSSSGDEIWQKSFGDSGLYESFNSIVPTIDGGYMACLDQSPPAPATYMLLQHTDLNGTADWNVVNSPRGFNNAEDIINTSDGNYIVCGNLASMMGSSVFYAAKLNTGGSIPWEKQFQFEDTSLYGVCAHELDDQSLLLGGTAYLNNAQGNQPFIVRLNQDGTIIDSFMVHFSGYNYLLDIEPTNDNGYRILYYHAGEGNQSIGIMYTDSIGQVTATRDYYYSDHIWPYRGRFTSDGGAIISGFSDLTHHEDVGILIRIDNNDELSWSRQFDPADFGGIDETLRLYDVREYSGGGYLLCGRLSNLTLGEYDMVVIKTDRDGLVQ